VLDFQNRALLNIDMPAWYYDGAIAKTRNLGSLGGSVQLGDGVTPATFPTQIMPHGMSFDGGSDYLNFLRPAELSFATLAGNELPFSLECLVRVDSYASIRSLFSKGIIGASMEYMSYLFVGSWNFYLIDSTQVAWQRLVVTGLTNSAPTGTIRHLVSTYDGTRVVAGVSMYVDGISRAITSVPAGVYTRMANFGADSVYSFANGSGAVPLLGSTYNTAVYPFALQPGEVAQLNALRRGLLQRGV
jgi:hypothetical protein